MSRELHLMSGHPTTGPGCWRTCLFSCWRMRPQGSCLSKQREKAGGTDLLHTRRRERATPFRTPNMVWISSLALEWNSELCVCSYQLFTWWNYGSHFETSKWGKGQPTANTINIYVSMGNVILKLFLETPGEERVKSNK